MTIPALLIADAEKLPELPGDWTWDKLYEETSKLVDKAEVVWKYHVAELATRSRNAKKVYIDPHVPRILPKTKIRPAQTLPFHELSEWLMQNEGLKYLPAHHIATVIERRRVDEVKKGAWPEYEKEMDGLIDEVDKKHEKPLDKNEPRDQDKRVFEDARQADSASLTPVSIADTKRSHDPTGTAGLRRGFRAAGQMRLRRLRSLMRQALTEYDMLGLDTKAPIFQAPTQRLETFTRWLGAEAQHSLLSPWHQEWTARAYRSGAVKAAGEVAQNGVGQMLPPGDLSHLHAVAEAELKGIAAALTQHVTRRALMVTARRMRPATAHRYLVKPFDKLAEPRMKAFANTTTVAAHNAAKIDVYRQKGIQAVGIIPELARAHTHDVALADQDEGLFGAQTAGDNLVCPVCEDIADDSPYTLAEIIGLLPAHPNCRCTYYPWGSDE